MAVRVEDIVPLAVLGAVGVGAILALRPSSPVVIGGSGGGDPEAERAKVEAVGRLAEIAAQLDVARLQAATAQAQAAYEARVRELEAELERRRIEAEKEVAQAGAQSQFWGTFWTGLFGLAGTIAGALLGLSDERLYQEKLPLPPYIGPSGQLGLLARREYGHSG